MMLPRGTVGATVTSSLGSPMSHRFVTRIAFYAVLAWAPTLAALAGCETSLGECDTFLARRPVYQEGSGAPAYEGQALMEVSCASTFCHTPDAEGEARKAVPAGLDFDVSLACSPEAECTAEDLQRLRDNQRRVDSWAGRILRTVETGDMPPGAEGHEVVESNTRAFGYREVDEGPELPAIDSSEGQEILRNWLACGAPVVERGIEPSAEWATGADCNDAHPPEVGDCVVGAAPDVLEPTWASIFDRVIVPECVPCHNPEEEFFLEQSALDLSTSQGAYDALVDAPAAGVECEGEGTLVVPGDPDASLLMPKLEVRLDDTITVCGDGMPTPPLDPLSQAQIDVIRQWITDGAPGPE